MNNRRYIFLSILLATMWLSPSAGAADDENKPKKLVLYPAAAPRPALKYQLLPTVRERKPGNAVVFYGKIKAEQNNFFCNRELQDKLESYREAPLEELRDAKEIDVLPGVLRFLKRGVVCEDSDWQITIREDGFETLLPEIQESRQYARYLQTLARKQIALGKFDEAVETLKCGYAFGRHVGNNPTLVAGLVGNAIIGIMSETLEEFIQQPGAPNLYWALTYLPQPIIDLRQNLDGETIGFDVTFPELFDVDEPIKDPDYWHRRCLKTAKTLDKVADLFGEDSVQKMSAMKFDRDSRSYQAAKRALTERGMTAEEVEAMPAGRAILMATAKMYEDAKDEQLKCYFLPYWEAEPLLDRAEKNLKRMAQQREEPLPITSRLLPANRVARTAFARLEQRIAFLRVVEALRLHGAANGGHLPKRLDDVTVVPIPVDPVTGKKFSYELRGDTGLLEAAPMLLPIYHDYLLRREISFGKTPPQK